MLLVAVSVSAQASFGLKAGLNMSTVTSGGESADMKIGYKVGPALDVALAPTMSIQAAALLSLKGAKNSDANYLEIPICFAYKFPIAPDTKIYLNAGPYFAYGIFGKTGSIDTFDDDFGIEKLDYGATIGVGAEVLKFNFGLNYDFGLADISKSLSIPDMEIIKNKVRNGNFWLSVGFYF